MLNDDPDVTGHLQSTMEQMKDIFGDIIDDYEETILEADQDLSVWLNEVLLTILRSGKPNAELMQGLATLNLWMFLIGREHASRGFASPVPRRDCFVEELVDDESLERFLEPD